MHLITNEDAGHRAAIHAVLADCEQALVAVAFLKKEGAAFLCSELRPLLKRNGRARVFIGSDFYLTEPDALQPLLDLASVSDGLEVFLGSRKSATFHPKTRRRYDRKALDAHLDRIAGLDSSAELNVNKADAELARFIADHPHAARSP